MSNIKTVLKINGFPKESEWNKMILGQQLPYHDKLKEFKISAKIGYVNKKRKSYKSALSKFIKLYDVKEYYAALNEDGDSFLIYYK